jgi:hypothetical protein
MDANRERSAWDGPLLSSLAAFLRAGVRPQSMLARAIVAVLVVKLVAVAAMSVFHSYTDRSELADVAGVAQRLGPTSPP